MKTKIVFGSRVLLALIFLIFGLNGLAIVFFGKGFLPMPPPKPEVMEVMGGLFKLGYLLPLVKGLEVISGILLLTGRYINLAITLLAPIIVNILCVHMFVDLSGLPMALAITILFLVVLQSRWRDFKPILMG